jgi:hypothetical protein
MPLPQQDAQIPTPVSHPSNLYSSLEQAIADIPPPNWNCPLNDLTIPATDSDRQQWVLKLLKAINNVTNVNDKQGAGFKKRWYDPITGPSNYYLPLDKELLCWDILDLAEQMHRTGPSVLLSFDQGFSENARKTCDWTFERRMEKIVELLAFSKARCEKLLGGGSVQLVVANPTVLLFATMREVKQNGKRQAILEAGRPTKKQKTEV